MAPGMISSMTKVLDAKFLARLLLRIRHRVADCVLVDAIV